MAKPQISWSKVRPVFADAEVQVKFNELLRTTHGARAALAKLQAKANDRETLEFFLYACSGIHNPYWMTAACEPDPLTSEDVCLIRERALWLANMMILVNGNHEDAPNPLFYIERAPDEVVVCGAGESDDAADAVALRRKYARAARVFMLLPEILSVLAKFIEPWYQATEHSKGLPAVNREPLMAQFYAYAHTVAKLTQPEVATLLTAGRVALGRETQSVSGDSLKTIVNRFKGSNRQAYEHFIKAVQLYLQRPLPRASFVDLAGMASGLPSLEISRLVRISRRKQKKG
jgi:hypothetical protein